MIDVVLVDDEPMVREHLGVILGAAEGLRVVGEAGDGAEAVEAVLRHRPRVVLMDLRMPGVDGIAATERIAALPDPPVVVALTTFADDSHVARALEAGAAGFLVKSTPMEELVGLVRVAAGGHAVLSREVAGGFAVRAGASARARERVAGLSPRDRDILGCLAEGMTNAEIGARLFLAETTVRGYVSRLLTRLDLNNRTRAGLLAREAGLRAPERPSR